MESLLKEHDSLERRGNLKRPISDTQNLIDQLKEARNAAAADPSNAALTIAKLNNPVKSLFQRYNETIKEAHNGQRDYSKALGNKFKDKPLAFAENDALSSQAPLINRAIAMHLLREGHFDVATTFIAEANSKPPAASDTDHKTRVTNGDTSSHQDQQMEGAPFQGSYRTWEADFSPTANQSANLQQQFSEMYHILHELRERQNLSPAIEWARDHSAVLETRGSNLEYDLCVLQYVTLLKSTQPFPNGGVGAAVAYARKTFPQFPPRYMAQSQALFGALPYASNIANSPYASLFSADSSGSLYSNDTSSTTAAAASAFTAEFCALLSLSSASPLLTAVTAGCISLPTLLKLSQIQAAHRTSWTTASELPVEVPLPPAFQFHSVFVCPVSKEQSTDANPPMMMPCGHLVAKESLEKLSRGTRFKCPYCPAESNPSQAKMVFL